MSICVVTTNVRGEPLLLLDVLLPLLLPLLLEDVPPAVVCKPDRGVTSIATAVTVPRNATSG